MTTAHQVPATRAPQRRPVAPASVPAARPVVAKHSQWLWLAGGLAVAFALPFLLADLASLERDLYYGLYSASVFALFGLWLRFGGQGAKRVLTRNWRWGVGLGVVGAGAMTAIALGEESTAHPDGWAFAAAILWRGVVYGAADGVLLSAFPILVVFAAFGPLRMRSKANVAGIGALALAATLAFTAVYHLGYSDFRGSKLGKPVVGDLVWSAPTLATLSPFGAPIAHVGLHVTAVVHAYDTETFLPPHAETPDAPAAAERPELQRVLDGLVTGPARVAPGATAYVSGPRGTWVGSAGTANVETGEPMRPAARMRLESVSKIYTAAIVHRLAQEGTLSLSDTLDEWLPGMFPYGDRVTLTQLLIHTSGMVDDNAFSERPWYYVSLIRDPRFKAEFVQVARLAAANPSAEISPLILVRLAAALPPLFPPGTQYRYSNTGFLVLGLVASRATGKSMPQLFRELVAQPLGLTQTAWDPQGPIAGPHARGYEMRPDGTAVDATAAHVGKGADGAVVSNAAETARFLRALMAGRLLGDRQLARMKYSAFWDGGEIVSSGEAAWGHGGGGAGFKTGVYVSGDGSRVAVLLLNGRFEDGRTDNAAARAVDRLFTQS
jgi:D-alanyl-D-alanine carboxypeptidase